MKKITALKVSNVLLLIFFINQAVSVIFREYYSLKAFTLFHMDTGIILLCLMGLHIFLNLNWFKSNFVHKKPLKVNKE
ncbi:MAG: hypothetical protein A2Y10_18220 [Planctomycetes bacterium GWF2_41_51]|nr:MAG: hypothetical protein A2Y10_18220 [Planctomycetes bacterium GWF2_41_51]HBG27954.1 hypothetical protein [Phycisphaerales bacterium]